MKPTKRILSVVLAVAGAALARFATLPAAATVTSDGTYWQEDFIGQERDGTPVVVFYRAQIHGAMKTRKMRSISRRYAIP